MSVEETEKIGSIGRTSVQLAVEKIGYIFREQKERDHGIDAHVEIVKDGKATGQLIALQIKSGDSWFKEKNDKRVIFRDDNDHLDYWLNHSLPVLVVLYNPSEEVAYWQIVNDDTVIMTGKGWKLEVPFTQKLTKESKNYFEELVGKPIKTKGKYSILSLRDVSHGSVKRYSANVLVPESFTRLKIIETVQEVTNSLKNSEYYGNDLTKQRFKKQTAQAIFLFIYPTLEDVRQSNWVCKSLWIDKHLPSDLAPNPIEGKDIGNNITISWSDTYQAMQELREQYTLTKEDFLAHMEAVRNPVTTIVEGLIKLTRRYEIGELNHEAYLKEMTKAELRVTELYIQVTDIGLAPLECEELSNCFQSIMAYAHNIVLPFSKKGLKTWMENNRRYLVRKAIEDYQKKLPCLKYELEKIH